MIERPMPRKRPARMRAQFDGTPTTTGRGLPATTAHALDRLGRQELASDRVAASLATWQRVASSPRAALTAPNSDLTEFIGPIARRHLEQALQALSRGQAGPLRAEVRRLDEEFESKTLNNPRADPSLPWWARRWWH